MLLLTQHAAVPAILSASPLLWLLPQGGGWETFWIVAPSLAPFWAIFNLLISSLLPMLANWVQYLLLLVIAVLGLTRISLRDIDAKHQRHAAQSMRQKPRRGGVQISVLRTHGGSDRWGGYKKGLKAEHRPREDRIACQLASGPQQSNLEDVHLRWHHGPRRVQTER